MSEHTVSDDKAPIVVGATGQEEILQNVRTIISTLRGQVPLDRSFARTGQALDRPTNKAIAAEVSELFRAIARHEPRVKVLKINFKAGDDPAMQGRLQPVVRLRILEED